MAPDMSGYWKRISSENMNAYVTAKGRRPASDTEKIEHMTTACTITQDGESITFKYDNIPFGLHFEPGKVSEFALPGEKDTQKDTGTWHGNKHVVKEVGVDHTATREVIDGKLHKTMNYMGIIGTQVFVKA